MHDHTTFQRLFEATYEDLTRFVERRTPTPAVDDVVSEVFLVAWRCLDDLPTALDDARPWLFAVAQRVLSNQRRSDTRRTSLQVRVGHDLALLDGETTADHSTEVAARLDLARAWSRLSPTDQEALTLTGLDGLNGPQAARVLGISTTAFSVRLARARGRLRLHLHSVRTARPNSRTGPRTTAQSPIRSLAGPSDRLVPGPHHGASRSPSTPSSSGPRPQGESQ